MIIIADKHQLLNNLREYLRIRFLIPPIVLTLLITKIPTNKDNQMLLKLIAKIVIAITIIPIANSS